MRLRLRFLLSFVSAYAPKKRYRAKNRLYESRNLWYHNTNKSAALFCSTLKMDGGLE
jgi:hypothetical protein